MLNDIQAQNLLMWIVLLPLAAAVINGLFGRHADRQLVVSVAVGAVGISFLLAIYCFVDLISRDPTGASFLPASETVAVYEWFSLSLPSGDVPIRVRFVMDALSSVMTLVVTGIGFLIHLYSAGYMSEEKSYARFFAYLNLFTASMLILVLASNLPLMFVGWEGVGLCSYLLIGFWYENESYAAAGKKAFIANRIGDFGVLIGMFILVTATGSFEFADINAAAAGLDRPLTVFGVAIGSMATVAALFLFLGCTGKSAQVPLYVWLPDAMAGPTPVSALIHAATMVTAGVYLTCRLSAVFLQSPTAMVVIAIVGTVTALLAASIALVQKELKKILAYSTVSQLGFMFAAVGVGAFAAGFFHVFTHAFFKACLFLGAGSVMHAVGAHGDANIFKLGGLKKILPATHLTFLFSCLAIAGFPLTSGFFSKDEIFLGATQLAFAEAPFSAAWVGWFVFGGLTIAATMTAFYMFRMYFLTFWGEYRSANDKGAHAYDAHPHESPWTMTVPLWVLGGGALIVGFLGLPHWQHMLPSWWGSWMAGAVQTLPGFGVHDEIASMTPVGVAVAGSLFAVTVGIFGAWRLYGSGTGDDPFTSSLPAGLHQLAFDKWRVDELYAFLFLRPLARLAALSSRIDKIVVDGLLTWLTSQSTALVGWLLTRVQTGLIFTYGAAMAVGLMGIVLWFVVPHPRLEVEVLGQRATLTAAAGPGYRYRFDFDNDGVFDLPAQRDGMEVFADLARVEKEYGDLPGTPVLLLASIDGDDVLLPLSDDADSFRPATLPPGWQAAPEDDTPPSAVVRDGKVMLRPNGAYIEIDGQLATDEVALEPGQRILVGRPSASRAVMQLAKRTEAAVEVRNAFQLSATAKVDVIVRMNAGAQTQSPKLSELVR